MTRIIQQQEFRAESYKDVQDMAVFLSELTVVSQTQAGVYFDNNAKVLEDVMNGNLPENHADIGVVLNVAMNQQSISNREGMIAERLRVMEELMISLRVDDSNFETTNVENVTILNQVCGVPGCNGYGCGRTICDDDEGIVFATETATFRVCDECKEEVEEAMGQDKTFRIELGIDDSVVDKDNIVDSKTRQRSLKDDVPSSNASFNEEDEDMRKREAADLKKALAEASGNDSDSDYSESSEESSSSDSESEDSESESQPNTEDKMSDNDLKRIASEEAEKKRLEEAEKKRLEKAEKERPKSTLRRTYSALPGQIGGFVSTSDGEKSQFIRTCGDGFESSQRSPCYVVCTRRVRRVEDILSKVSVGTPYDNMSIERTVRESTRIYRLMCSGKELMWKYQECALKQWMRENPEQWLPNDSKRTSRKRKVQEVYNVFDDLTDDQKKEFLDMVNKKTKV